MSIMPSTAVDVAGSSFEITKCLVIPANSAAATVRNFLRLFFSFDHSEIDRRHKMELYSIFERGRQARKRERNRQGNSIAQAAPNFSGKASNKREKPRWRRQSRATS